MESESLADRVQEHNNILLATDLSDGSFLSNEAVIAWLKTNKLRVYIVHALELFQAYAWGYGQLERVEQQIIKEAQEKMSCLAGVLHVSESNTYLKKMPSKFAIIETAKQVTADLIVLERHKGKHLFNTAGSIVSSVVNMADCDVLVLDR